MAHKLLEKSLLEVFDSAPTRLSAVGDTRGIMEILVKCTLETAQKFDAATNAIRDFNSSTSKLTKVIIALNIILVLATVINLILAFK